MSLLIGNYDGKILNISNYKSSLHKGQVKCNVCNNNLIGKKGEIKVHHYSHESKDGCVYDRDNDGKSGWHILWQNLAKDEYLEKVVKKDGKLHIADIMYDDKVIEVQHSTISEEKIEDREKFYGDMIWILDGIDRVNVLFMTNNNYSVIQSSCSYWSKMKKTKYTDVGYGIMEIIKYYGKNVYLCKNHSYANFLSKEYKNILKNSLSKSIEALCSKEYKVSITKCDYDYTKDIFSGTGTYEIKSFLKNMCYIYDKEQKHYRKLTFTEREKNINREICEYYYKLENKMNTQIREYYNEEEKKIIDFMKEKRDLQKKKIDEEKIKYDKLMLIPENQIYDKEIKNRVDEMNDIEEMYNEIIESIDKIEQNCNNCEKDTYKLMDKYNNIIDTAIRKHIKN